MWQKCRMKNLFIERVERSIDGKETHLSMSQKYGLVADLGEKRMLSESYVGGKLCYKDDIVLNRLKAHLGVFALAPQSGVISPDYTVLTPFIERISPKFAEYYLKSDVCRTELQIRVRGVVEGFWRLYTDDFYAIEMLLPPRNEQDQIVRYLDWKVSQINKLINAKKKQIELLQEQKQVVGSEAFIKDSDSWEAIRFRFLCKITTGNKDTVNREDNGVYPFYVRSPKVERISTYSHDGEAILMAGDGVGAGRVFHYVNGRFDFHQRVYCFYDFNVKIFARYLHYYMAVLFPRVVDKGTAKSTVDSIRLNMLQDFVVSFPSYPEQKSIVTHLDQQCVNIDRIISKLNEEITLFSEYRTRLISDVVTGKRDVRGAVVSDYEARENTNVLKSEYLCIAGNKITRGSEKMSLGDINNRICRFCQKSETETTFDSAHAFPQFIGNKKLLSHYECKECNKFFSNPIEDSFSKFFMSLHTFFGVRGSKSIPKFKPLDGSCRIEYRKIRVNGKEVNAIINKVYAEEGNKFCPPEKGNKTISIPIQPYIPIAVYKCFVKMALSVMPECEISAFLDTISWLMNPKHENFYEDKRELYLRFTQLEGTTKDKSIVYSLYKNVNINNNSFPYMLFRIIWGQFVCEIDVPIIAYTNRLGIKDMPICIRSDVTIKTIHYNLTKNIVVGKNDIVNKTAEIEEK